MADKINIILHQLVATNMRIRDKELLSKNDINLHRLYMKHFLFVASFVVSLIPLMSVLTNPSSLYAQQEGEEGEEGVINQDNATTASTSTAANISNASSAGFVSNIEQIRGHIEQAIVNKEADNNTLAKAHTLHPIEEVYGSIAAEISSSDPDLNQSLSSSLNELPNMVDNSTIEDFKIRAGELNGLLNETISKVVSTEQRNNATFNLMVVADLLSVADVEYKEAVENGTVKEIVEYQDGQAFISRAQSVFNQSAPMIPQEESAEVEEINSFFSDLENAVQSKADPEVVANSIRAIVHEISEVTGVSEENLSPTTGGGGDPVAIISEIRNLLNQILDAYNNQDYSGAETLAIQAYLDNFEFIEDPIAERDEALMENTEIILREELRQLIQDRVSLEQIQQHIDKINSSLDQAEQLLSSESKENTAN